MNTQNLADARTSLEAILVDLDVLTALSGSGLSAAVQDLVPCCYLLQYLLQEGHSEPLVRRPSTLSECICHMLTASFHATISSVRHSCSTSRPNTFGGPGWPWAWRPPSSPQHVPCVGNEAGPGMRLKRFLSSLDMRRPRFLLTDF